MEYGDREMAQRTVKQILEEAVKRILEEHDIRIESVDFSWIVRTDGDAYPVSVFLYGEAK